MEFTLEKLMIDLPDLPKLNTSDIVYPIVKGHSQIQNDILEKAVRENSTPSIKGELTKGKIRWRGLRMIHRRTDSDGSYETWIEQRGKRITPIVVNEVVMSFIK